jgi:hypothetical protein
LSFPGIVSIAEVEKERSVGRENSLHLIERGNNAVNVLADCFFKADLFGDLIVSL